MGGYKLLTWNSDSISPLFTVQETLKPKESFSWKCDPCHRQLSILFLPRKEPEYFATWPCRSSRLVQGELMLVVGSHGFVMIQEHLLWRSSDHAWVKKKILKLSHEEERAWGILNQTSVACDTTARCQVLQYIGLHLCYGEELLAVTAGSRGSNMSWDLFLLWAAPPYQTCIDLLQASSKLPVQLLLGPKILRQDLEVSEGALCLWSFITAWQAASYPRSVQSPCTWVLHRLG